MTVDKKPLPHGLIDQLLANHKKSATEGKQDARRDQRAVQESEENHFRTRLGRRAYSRDWSSLRAEHVVQTLNRLKYERSVPSSIPCDNGSGFISRQPTFGRTQTRYSLISVLAANRPKMQSSSPTVAS